MAHIVTDRVKEFSTSTGTGNFTVAGVSGAFEPFSAHCSVGDTFWYCIAEMSGSGWEVGRGTYSAANTIARTTVYSSSNGNALVNFPAGAKDVFITVSAHIISKITEINTARILGRATAGTGELEELTASQVKSMLGLTGAVLYDTVQSLNTSQQLQASTNIGVGNPEVDLTAIYVAAKT